MEVTVYALFSVFVYLMFFIVYGKKDVINEYEYVILKLMLGILFIALAIFSMKIDFDLPNGSPASFTPVSEDLITNLWQRGLFVCYFLFGLLQIVWASLDGKEFIRHQKIQKEEELNYGD